MEAKFRAMEIANFYVQLIQSIPDNSIDNLKLNKILYYVQGWSLVKNGHPLFSDEIQAWDFGPVIPDVYHHFKICGRNPIGEAEDDFDESRLTTEELELLIDVYRNYGRFTGWALKDMTHRKGSPWDQVFEERKNRVIPVESMKEYFEKEELASFDIAGIRLPVITEVPLAWDTAEDAVYG